jgi:hypothetical protein
MMNIALDIFTDQTELVQVYESTTVKSNFFFSVFYYMI